MPTLTQVIDPLSIATNGLVGGIIQSKQVQYVNALTTATMGWIAFIEESIIPPEPEVPAIEPSGGRAIRPKKAKPAKKKKRFVVTVEIDGRMYTQTKYTEDLTISADDINVKIDETQGKPTLRVFLPNKDENDE